MASQDNPVLRITDLVVMEPRLRRLSRALEDENFVGLCAEGDGDVADWLVLPRPEGNPRAIQRRLVDAAGVIFLDSEFDEQEVLDSVEGTGAVLYGTDGITRQDIRRAVDELLRRQPNLASWRKLSTIGQLSPGLVNPAPESEILARFARFSGDSLLLLTVDGRVIAAAGELPARSIARSLSVVINTAHDMRGANFAADWANSLDQRVIWAANRCSTTRCGWRSCSPLPWWRRETSSATTSPNRAR
ncbi:hypothetical protein [Corynebacterium sp. Marseille-Q2823]|uniref:hypothetical protein n=1 Tax=Corynebacterium sp. Marseille-Q2823 TaxID=2736606 RepID=UPI0020CA2859|nr:hypothetical protein [Corynebacterium sp. Marseille-Q2823]